jgi:hypothetical protein
MMPMEANTVATGDADAVTASRHHVSVTVSPVAEIQTPPTVFKAAVAVPRAVYEPPDVAELCSWNVTVPVPE